VLVVNSQFSAKTVADVIALAKAQPRKLNYASTGAGGYPHLDILRLEKATGTLMTHIPYNSGAGQVVRALLANEVQVSFLNLASALPHIKAGKLRSLAATTPGRIPDLPDVPTMTESGFAGIGTTAWQGLFAPAATPQAVLDKLHSAISKALAPSELREQLTKQGLNLVLSKSAQDYTEFTRAETKRWAEFLAQNPVKVE
jgi:tripartite-type tricarboxylate transporter receptor subunit TctC